MAVLKYYNTTTSAWEYIAASTTANFTTWKKAMSGGETSVSGTDDNAVTLSYTVGLEQVFINGVLQVRGTDYVATTGTSVTGLSALVASDIVTVVCYAPFNIANTIAPTVIDAKGDLLAGTAADTVGRLAVGTNNQLLAADSAESTGLKWVASPTTSKVVQIVYGSTSTNTNSSSSTYADTGLTATITPTSASNNVLVMVDHGSNQKETNNTSMGMRLLRAGTQIAQILNDGGKNGTNDRQDFGGTSVTVLDSPATTSATIYKTTFNSVGNNAVVTVQSGFALSTIILMEVTP
jgi:hypothetical protein